MSTALDRTLNRRDELISQLESIAGADDFNPEDAAYVALRSELDDVLSTAERLQDFSDALARSRKLDSAGRKTDRSLSDKPQPKSEQLSPGEAFTRSEAFTEYPGRGTGRKHRALPSSTVSFADVLRPALRVDTTDPVPTYPLLDLVGTTPVQGSAVEYVVWATAAGAADVVAEGAAKPSIEFAPTVTSDTLATVAVWTHLTRQLLEQEPAVRATIDQLLRNDVRRALNGLATTALSGATLPTAVNADLLTAIRMAKGTVEAAGYVPNAVLLNPADYAALDVAVMTTAGGNPNVQPTYWGLRPVASNDQAAGTAVVGDFGTGMTHFTGGGTDLYISDSDQDDFIKNLFKILAETRSLFAVVRPAAFCETAAA